MGRSRRRTTLERAVIVCLVAAVVLAALPATGAAQSRSEAGGTVVVEEGETVDELSAFGGSVVVRGTVTGDVSAVGGDVSIEGTVEGDVSAVGGNVEISGDVGGDVSAAGGSVTVAEGATITGALEAGAGNVRIDGSIEGDATVGADRIRLGDGATIGGDLRYDGTLEGDTGVVAGEVTRDATLAVDVRDTVLPIVSWAFAVYAFLLNLLLGALLLALFPDFSRAVADRVANDPVRTGLAGFAVLVGVPLVLAALAITVVGIPFSIAGAFAFALIAWIGVVYGRFAVGAWLLSLLDVGDRWLALLVGLLLGAVLGRIPIVGGVFDLLFFLLGLGALSTGLYARRRRRRESPTATAAGEATTD